MAAAVSDYVPAYAQVGKLKKESLGDEWDLKLKQNVDILKTIDKSDITTVGFKAEMDEEHAVINALKMIDSKGIDAVCLNVLKDSSSFGTDTNKKYIIHKYKKESIPLSDKLNVALGF
jgi:phosphopantothenoylcysteine decarboxylase/phosphopantothenate--cysteine ligase